MHRIIITPASGDAADSEYQCNRLPAIVRTPGAAQIFIQIEQLRSFAGLALYVAVDFIAICNRVHQFRSDCLFAQIRSRVHQRLELLRRNLTRLADAILHLVEP